MKIRTVGYAFGVVCFLACSGTANDDAAADSANLQDTSSSDAPDAVEDGGSLGDAQDVGDDAELDSVGDSSEDSQVDARDADPGEVAEDVRVDVDAEADVLPGDAGSEDVGSEDVGSGDVGSGDVGSEGAGRLVFHRYSTYEAWDSELFLVDLEDYTVTQISEEWEIDHAMNAHFSPDGTRLTFMGDQTGGDRDWDVFLWTIGSAEPPLNLTAGWGTRDEDPKFSPEGTIVLKSNLDLVEVDLSGRILTQLTDDGGAAEESMPYCTVDGASILYARGARSGSDIHHISRDGSSDTAVQALVDLQEYYPVVRDAEGYFFTRWVSTSNVNDQIYLGFFDGSAALRLEVNDEENNYSDAFPYGEDDLFFSSTRPGGEGGYDLYYVGIEDGSPISLSEWNPAINTDLEELGAAFYR